MAEEAVLDRAGLLADLQAPVGSVDGLMLTRVGWEDLLDRYPSYSRYDLPRLRSEFRVNPNPKDYRRLIRLLYRLSRPATASRTAREALSFCMEQAADKPTNANLQYELGLAWVNLREYGQALEALGAALQLGQKRPEVYAAYALACLSVGQLDTAKTTVGKAAEAFPDRPEVLVAAHYVHLNANCQAPDALAQAVAQPDPAALIKLLALDELRKAVESDPSFVMARRTLGSVIVECVLERARQHSGILGSLGDLRALKADEELLKEGGGHLDQALQLDALTPAQTLWRRAVAFILAGETVKAEELGRRALSVYWERPQDEDSLFKAQYVGWLMERGDIEPVKAFLDRDASRVPSPQDLALRASCAWKLGKPDSAERSVRELFLALARTLSPDERRLRSAGHAILGACALSRGEARQAEQEYQAARGWSLNVPWATYGLAVSQFLAGEKESAVSLRQVAGLLAKEDPAQRLLAALAGNSPAQEAAERNRRALTLPAARATVTPEFLHRHSDWLIGFLALWRSLGPAKASEQAATDHQPANGSVRTLLNYWDSPDFPEPRLDLLAAARFAAAACPDAKARLDLLAKLKSVSDRTLGGLELMPLSEEALKAAFGEEPGKADAIRASMPKAFQPSGLFSDAAEASVRGCDTPLEKAHALSAWLTLRPRLEFSLAGTVEKNFELLSLNPRARVTPDEKAALFIAAARSVGLKACLVSLPRLKGVDCSAPSCAGVVLEKGLLLVAPELGVFGRGVPGFRIVPEQEARGVFHALLPGEGRIRRCQRAVEAFPDSARIQLALAECLLNEAGQAEMAEKHAAKAVELAGDLPEAHIIHGAALEMLGREAETAFRKAVRLNPASGLPFHARGIIMARRGQLSAAAAEFLAALDIRPHHQDIRAALAACLAPGEHKQEALEQAREVLIQSDARDDVRMLMLDLYYDLGKKEDLILELEELLAAQPENEKARKFLVEAYKEAGMDTEAESLEKRGKKGD
jgi:tetratricopeptide (TPR) repeat protein